MSLISSDADVPSKSNVSCVGSLPLTLNLALPCRTFKWRRDMKTPFPVGFKTTCLELISSHNGTLSGACASCVCWRSHVGNVEHTLGESMQQVVILRAWGEPYALRMLTAELSKYVYCVCSLSCCPDTSFAMRMGGTTSLV